MGYLHNGRATDPAFQPHDSGVVSVVSVDVNCHEFDFNNGLLVTQGFAKSSIIDKNMATYVFNNPNGNDITFRYIQNDSKPVGFLKIVMEVKNPSVYQNLPSKGKISFDLVGSYLTMNFN